MTECRVLLVRRSSMPWVIMVPLAIRLNSPNSRARVTAPASGWANSTTPNATQIRPVRMNMVRVPAVSPGANPAKIPSRPP